MNLNKTNLERVIQIIKNQKPSKINFAELKSIYKRFR